MIYTFDPILKTTIWGGDRIASFKEIDNAPASVGESWEISGVNGSESVVSEGPDKGLTLSQLIARHGTSLVGERVFSRFGDQFPLLIKFIDANADLSVQVHPDDELARRRHNSFGKTEMWYVIDTNGQAHLKSGLSRQLSPDEYVKAVADNTIGDYLKEYDVTPGDLFYLPAGRVHSIGAGCFIAEIQQTSDITYRIYDFNRLGADGRPRQLHTDLAKDAIDYTVSDDYRTHYTARPCDITPLVDCDYFTVSLVDTDNCKLELPRVDSFIAVIAVAGDLTVEADGEMIELRRGHTALIPASVSVASLRSVLPARALIAYLR